MNEDELVAFQKIMGDVDRQEEKQSDGSPNDTRTGEKDEQERGEGDPAALSEDIDPITSQNPTDAEAVNSEDRGDDSLDEDQQKAFESIMAQIEGDDLADAGSVKETGDVSESEPADDFSAGLEKEVKEADADDDAGPEDAQHLELQNDETHRSSYDIEDILTAIALSDDESHLPEAASEDSGSEKATVEASEKKLVDDDIVAHQKADSGLEHTDRPQTATSAGQIGKTAEPDERPLVKGPSVDPRSATKPTSARFKDPQKPKPLHEASKPAIGRQKKAVLASVVVILCLALAGYFYGISQNMLASKPVIPDTDIDGRDTADVVQSAIQVQNPVAVVHGPSDQSRLNSAAENLDRLRGQIIEKQSEIGELRAYYQAGIDTEIQGIADKVRNAGKGGIPFKSAIADPSISLGLSAIQRRDAYIKKLETPASILDQSSEALLFLSRKAALLALMAGKTSDIDIDGFIKQADEIRNMRDRELSQLNIDAVPVSSRTLASIWQDIEKRLSTTPVKTDIENRVTNTTDNATIWRNICDGDFSQKHRMTALSPDAARCLTRWKGKDLFLGALTDLSPDAARHLSAWEGDWLGLNGLRELSPETAVHLSRWKGKGLSLNSLSRLSPRVVAILSDWQGDQIELINVKHMVHWENPKTRLFLSEDLKHKLEATGK